MIKQFFSNQKDFFHLRQKSKQTTLNFLHGTPYKNKWGENHIEKCS